MDGLSLIRAETLSKGKRATRARTFCGHPYSLQIQSHVSKSGNRSRLELPALLQFHAETTRELTDGEAVSFAIASEQVRVGKGRAQSMALNG